jgi:hypothetical protein
LRGGLGVEHWDADTATAFRMSSGATLKATHTRSYRFHVSQTMEKDLLIPD